VTNIPPTPPPDEPEPPAPNEPEPHVESEPAEAEPPRAPEPVHEPESHVETDTADFGASPPSEPPREAEPVHAPEPYGEPASADFGALPPSDSPYAAEPVGEPEPYVEAEAADFGTPPPSEPPYEPAYESEPPPPPPPQRGFDRRTILIAIAAVALVLIVIAVTLYTNRRPGEPLIPVETPTTAAVEDEEWPGLSELDRLHVRPERIARPVLGPAMSMTILSGYADLEFTVGADGRASDIRVVRESAEDIGYGAEAVRLVRGALWPTDWRGRTAPYPARYRVIFPPGRAGREIAPLAIASPILTPEILALRRNVVVTLHVRVSPEGLVESAQVIESDVENAAVAAEAMRVALSARYPPNPGAAYETQLVVHFDVLGALQGQQPQGPTVSLSEVPFTQRPSGSDFARHYPRRALSAGIEGRVTLDCTVRSNLRLNCAVASEDPPGAGFGQAALRIARQFRAARQFPDGRPTVGAHVSMPMLFQVE